MTTEPVPTEAPGFVPSDVPATIYMLNGSVFVISDIGAWGYVDQGIFGTGKFVGEETERDLLIPYERIDYYELDFEALKALAAKEAKA